MTALQEQLTAQAANVQQTDTQLESLLADKYTLEAQLQTQAGDLEQANSDLASTASQLSQLQSQHEEAATCCQQLEAEVASSSQELQQVKDQLEEKASAISVMQQQHTGQCVASEFASICVHNMLPMCLRVVIIAAEEGDCNKFVTHGPQCQKCMQLVRFHLHNLLNTLLC